MYVYRILAAIFIITVISIQLNAQNFNLSTQISIQKPFKLNKKNRLSINARVSANPEWEAVEQLSDNELWRDLDLLPVNDEEEEENDEDSDEENSNDEQDSEPWIDPLDDSAQRLIVDPRTALGIQYQWRLTKHWRILASYNTYWRGKEVRYGLDSGGQWRSRFKTKRWFFDQSLVFQQVFRPKQSARKISYGTRTRARITFNLTDNHQVRFASSINGNWREEGFRIDRLRLETEIRYAFYTNHRISLRVRMQKRLYRPDSFTPGLQVRYDYMLGSRDRNDVD